MGLVNPPCCGREEYLTQAADGYSLGHVSRILCISYASLSRSSLVYKIATRDRQKTGSHTRLILLNLSTTRNKQLLEMQSFALVGLLAALFTSGVTAGPYKRWGFTNKKLYDTLF